MDIKMNHEHNVHITLSSTPSKHTHPRPIQVLAVQYLGALPNDYTEIEIGILDAAAQE